MTLYKLLLLFVQGAPETPVGFWNLIRSLPATRAQCCLNPPLTWECICVNIFFSLCLKRYLKKNIRCLWRILYLRTLRMAIERPSYYVGFRLFVTKGTECKRGVAYVQSHSLAHLHRPVVEINSEIATFTRRFVFLTEHACSLCLSPGVWTAYYTVWQLLVCASGLLCFKY
jgi:hypothetical protein